MQMGLLVTSVEKQIKLWKTHFETILSKDAHVDL